MKDTIKIKNLEIYAYHGVFPEENKLGQKFIVSAELFTDFKKAIKNDDLAFSTNYAEVCKVIERFMKENTFKLIETAVNGIAEEILDNFPMIEGAVVELQKPNAPIGLPFKTVSAVTERKWHTAYISIGSNLGNKEKYLNDSIKQLSDKKGCIVEKVSDFIVTKPYGNVAQDDFLNGIIKIKTYLEPHELLDFLHEIENNASRKREIHWGPRTLDMDIVFYDNEIIDDETLHIPHIDMQNRDFVLKPLVQIAPFLRHPVLDKTAEQLLEMLLGEKK